MKERSFWLGFSLVPGIGPGRFAKILAEFGTAEDAWSASTESLILVIGSSLAHSFVSFRKQVSLEQYEDSLAKKAVSYVTLGESEYPQLLAQIKNPPFVLFYKGNRELLSAPHNPIGIVGTRKITSYGREVTERLTSQLVGSDCVIVSGLALGVDAVAHQTTIDHHGKTIAVLGCGVDCPYPQENAGLYTHILEHSGIVVSEYGLGVSPTKGSFPSRNRIIAGLSLGVVVTEGAAQSGALITAKDALKNGRKVFAVPGPVTSRLSEGTYYLLKQGATMVRGGKDVMDELGIMHQESARKRNVIIGGTEEERMIIDCLKQDDLHIDELAKRTGIAASTLGGILSLMEMKGMIKSLSAGIITLGA